MTNNTYILQGSDGSTIAFDDVQYGVLREDLENFANYPADYESSQTPGVVGARVINTVIEPRDLSFRVIIFGEGRAQLEERRRRLVKALNPLIGSCKLFWNLENGETYYINGVPDDSPSFSNGTPHHARTWECEITLTCHDPCWHRDSETSVILFSPDIGFQVPFQVPFTLGNASPYIDVDNVGTAPASVRIEMHGIMTAPLLLSNLTTGESITIRKNIEAGDTLTIDTDRNDLRVTYYDSSEGTTTSALSNCSVGSKFWSLVPGINHLLIDAFNKGAGAEITMTYRERQVAL